MLVNTYSPMVAILTRVTFTDNHRKGHHYICDEYGIIVQVISIEVYHLFDGMASNQQAAA